MSYLQAGNYKLGEVPPLHACLSVYWLLFNDKYRVVLPSLGSCSYDISWEVDILYPNAMTLKISIHSEQRMPHSVEPKLLQQVVKVQRVDL